MTKLTMSSGCTAKPASAAPNHFAPWPASDLGSQALSYWIDSWQRSLLFWDVMRERGNILLKRNRRVVPKFVLGINGCKSNLDRGANLVAKQILLIY